MDDSFLPSIKDELCLSPLETLPPELFAMIIEYVPESVLKLRRASKQLKFRIDDFARSCSLPLVDELEIEERRRYIYDMKIKLAMSRRMKGLFVLRYKTLDNLSGNQKMNHIKSSLYTDFELNSERVEDSEIDHFCLLIGRSVKQVKLNDELAWEPQGSPISKLLDHLQFSHLKIISDESITDESMSYIKTMITTHNIEHLHISVLEVNTTQDPEQILLELSSVLRTLHIYQFDHMYIERSYNYMFGIYDADWAQLITQMFSRKLDRLDIQTVRHTKYLLRADRKILRKQLPLIDKKIWFRAVTRTNRTNENWQYECNDFLIETDDSLLDSELRVRHSSRLNEPKDVFYYR